MLLLYFWRGGEGFLCFHATSRSPLFYICFITFFVQSRNSVIFVFSFLVVNLIVSVRFLFFFSCLCIGDKGGERAVIAVCVSSFHFFFFFFMKANEGIRGLGVLTPCFSFFFN